MVKAKTEAELYEEAERLFAKSELIVAQSYMPTDFDWRIGVFDGKPLWACRYHMADGHWQIVNNQEQGRPRSGRVRSAAARCGAEAGREDRAPRVAAHR